VLLVTHDHDLIDEVAIRLWHFKEDGIEDFQGPYAEWKGKHNERVECDDPRSQKRDLGRPALAPPPRISPAPASEQK
jgi:energy-coupling factor transporter ATP-binding protein EcfA2